MKHWHGALIYQAVNKLFSLKCLLMHKFNFLVVFPITTRQGKEFLLVFPWLPTRKITSSFNQH